MWKCFFTWHGPFGGIDFCWGEWDRFLRFLTSELRSSTFSSWRNRMRSLFLHCTLLMHVIFFVDFYQPLQHNSCATSCDVVSTFSIQSIGEFKLEINDVVSSSWFWSNRPCLWCSSLGPRWIKCKQKQGHWHYNAKPNKSWKYMRVYHL